MEKDWLKFLTRRKKFDSEKLYETNLSRVLGLTDLIALGKA